MSLINDALKRAGKAQGPPGHSVTVGLKPVEKSAARGAPVRAIAIAGLTLAALGAAGWFLWKGFKPGPPSPLVTKLSQTKTPGETNKTAKAAKSSLPGKGADATPAKSAGAERKPVQAAKAGGSASAGKVVKTPPTGPSKPAAGIATAPPPTPTNPPPAITWPALTLQGLIYRANHPAARLNHRTVYVGDEVEGARVRAIGPESVTLEFSGETHEIRLTLNGLRRIPPRRRQRRGETHEIRLTLNE